MLLLSTKGTGPKPFFVLDIDSTLVSTHQRNQAILNKFIAQFGETWADDCAQIQRAQCQFGDYGYMTSLQRVGFSPRSDKVLPALRRFWEEKFFSNEYLHHDLPIEGATEWVHLLKKEQHDFVYLTARHKKTMWDGTLKTMASMGFPIDDGILFLKESLEDSDELYKTKTLTQLRERITSPEIWFVDNEPVVLHSILKDHPDVRLVWYESCHSGKMQPPQEAMVIQSFF